MNTLRLQGPPGVEEACLLGRGVGGQTSSAFAPHPLPTYKETPRAAARSPQQAGDPGSWEGLAPAPRTPAHGNRSWSWMAPEAGSPQSEEGDPSGEDPGSPSRPCLQVLSRRRLEHRSANSRASNQQRPAGKGGVSGPELAAHGRAPCPAAWELAHAHPALPQRGAPTGPPTPGTWLFTCLQRTEARMGE